MTTAKWYPIFSTWRNFVILFYNLVLLTSLIATAIRDFHCDVGVLPAHVEELSPVHTSRLAIAKTNETWHKRILYAAAAVASSRKYQTENPRSPNSQNNEQLEVSSNISDYRIISEACGGDHGLEIQQDNTTFYIEGLPVFQVTMTNTCLDCSLRNVHIACGDWASATEVDPLVFKRVAENDCVVNDGKPILSQGTVIFEYSNSFPYPMNLQSSSPSCS